MPAKTNYDYPTDTPVVDENRHITVPWGLWVQRTHVAASSLQQSGITADRPTSVLFLGRPYFDITIGKPIWLRSVNPNVWVDATGAAV